MKPAYVYEIHLPPRMEPGRTYPTMFTLHGKGSHERNMYGLVEPLAEECILIGIRGDQMLGSGYQYYELKSLGHPLRDSFDRAVRQLTAFIEYATGAYPVDPERRYLLGFSQGAILSMTLALTMGEKLKGIVALNGYVPEFVKTEYPHGDTSGLAIFLSHGEQDQVFPVHIGQETAAFWQELTPNVTFRLYPAGHGVTEENREDFLQWLRSDMGIDSGKDGDVQ